jgi:serine/threonine protein kinase
MIEDLPTGPDPGTLARLAAEISQELPARYRLLGYLGQGAFASVWQAYDRAQLRPVAIKRFTRIRGERRGDFYKELTALSLLDHPHVVRLHDLRETDQGRQYLILEYCDGGTLRRALQRERAAWPIDKVARIGLQIAQGLEVAHRWGITHRDLKPENLLFLTNQHTSPIKIADFGLARTRRGLNDGRLLGLTGSPAYMAPEQYRGEWSAASDVYALGVILYEFLHGRTPFEGGPGDMARQHLYATPTIRSRLPRPWPELLERLLAKSPESRPTATELVIRLAALENQGMGNPEREKALQRDMQQLRSTLRQLAAFGESTDEPELQEAEVPEIPPVSPSELLERSREQLARLAAAARRPAEQPIPQASSAPESELPLGVALPVESDTALPHSLQNPSNLFAGDHWGDDLGEEELPLGTEPIQDFSDLPGAETKHPPQPETQKKVEDAFSNFGW